MSTVKPISGLPVRVVVIHWSPMIRLGIRCTAKTAQWFSVIGETADPGEGMSLIGNLQPDIVVMDMQFRTHTGFDFLRDLKNQWPEVRVLIYSSMNVPEYPERCLRAGASGYVGMSDAINNFVRAIARIGEGQIYLSEGCATEMFSRLRTNGRMSLNSPIERLSEGELGVLTLLAKGMSNRQIADALHRSIKTVETYRSRIKRKVGVANSTALAQFAVTIFPQLHLPRSTAGDFRGEKRQDRS